MSSRRVRGTLSLWQQHLPGVHPYYAVKCNPEPHLLNTLYAAGVSFDCASERELLEVGKLEAPGAPADRIIYANPCKSKRDLKAAKAMGAPTTVVDSVGELEKLASASGCYKGGTLIRIAVDDSASAMPFSTKFGCPVGDVGRLVDAAKVLRVPLRGVSFHVGSGSGGDTAHAKAIEVGYQCLLKMHGAGEGKQILDIGGGFIADPADFAAKAKEIRAAMKPLCGRQPVRFIAEPGRFFATTSSDFFVQVIGKKAAGAAGGYKYTLDDSLYGQFSNILFDYAQPKWLRVKMGGATEKPRAYKPGVLFGRTCDSVDVIARAESMEELEVGDWLWFPAMGAYTRATASEFNGFPTPPVVLTDDLPEPAVLEREDGVAKGVQYMPAVSAKAFWGVKGSS